jgi:hypothetical protein
MGEPIERVRAWKEGDPPLDLQNADFKNADLYFATLTGAQLKGADFSNALLHKASLAGADCTGANFAGALLTEADLSDATLNDASLIGCDLTSASLSGADLQGADLRNANAESAGFWGSNLNGTLFEGACLDDADLGETIFDLGHGIANLDALGVVTKRPKVVEYDAPADPTPNNSRRQYLPTDELLETDRDTGGGRKIEPFPTGMEDDVDPSESYHE